MQGARAPDVQGLSARARTRTNPSRGLRPCGPIAPRAPVCSKDRLASRSAFSRCLLRGKWKNASLKSSMRRQTRDAAPQRVLRLRNDELRGSLATYTIQIPGGQISKERKSALPEAVKDAHANVTGAPRSLTQ